jgi:predicted P-loop ATPase
MSISYPNGESSAFNFSEDSDHSNTGSFDIRDHLDKLDPGKGKGYYICPVCGGQRLGVDAKTGAYQCWSGGCLTDDIREAIRPLAEFLAERKGEQPTPQPKKPRAKKKERSAIPIPIGATLLRLPAPGQSPQPEQLAKDALKNIPRNALQTTYDYSPTQKVVRYEWPDPTNSKGHDKTYRQFHFDAEGKKVWKKGDARWPAYRLDEVVELLKAIPDDEPIIIPIPEGELSVELARNIGLAALTLQGSNWSDPETQKMLEALQATGKNVSLAVIRDNDDTGIKKGKGVGLVARHIQFPCLVIDPRVIYPDIPEKGDIREILEAIGPDEFLKRLESEIASQVMAMAAIEEKSVSTQQSKPSSVEPPVSGDNSLPAMCKNEVLVRRIEEKWGERLRLNEMTQQVEMDGDASNIDIDQAYIRAAKELHLDIDKQKASDIVVMCARENTYSPVREYLNSLAGKEPIKLESLAERYFGTQDPFHAILLKRTLIAAVARAFKPGCKVDTMCILQGGQGALKSTFWQTLAGETWFTDNLSEASEKDEKLKLRRYWILEFSEFETVYKRKDVEQLKAFLSSRIDSLRRPYGRSLEDFPRTSIFVGSTNRQEFLNDPTGGRRYWVIPVVAETIPIQTLEKERDQIWAAAVAAYRSGEQWWLTREEDKLLEEANKGWQSSDTWEVAVLNYLLNKSICTVPELFTHAIQIELAKQGKAEQMRLSDILRRNGWRKTAKRIEGKFQKCWEKAGSEVVSPQNPCSTSNLDKVIPPSNEVVSEVVSPSKPCPTIISGTLIPPDTTFLLKDYFDNNTDAEADISITNQTSNISTPSKGGNIGGITCSDDSQNPVGQSLRGDTTSPERGGITSSKVEKVTDEDAQAMRNIALNFWSGYYPEQIQGLITQMYGWQAPGSRYDGATLTEWLEKEDELIRDRLTELIRLRKR